MTVDPKVCRELSAWAEMVSKLESISDLRPQMVRVAAQLTAAADLAERKPLTEQQVREVVRAAIEGVGCSQHLGWFLTVQPARDDVDAIATRAAKELARETVTTQTLTAVDVNAIVGAAAMESFPDLTNEACMRVADRATAKLAGAVVGLSSEDTLELQERRSLDAHRKAEIDDLVARRQTDLDADDRASLQWAHEFIGVHAFPDNAAAGRMLGLIDRMLATDKDDPP